MAGLKFRRQVSIGPWIVDFLCVEQNLVIEIDGGYHDLTQEKDRQRERQLTGAGYRVIRFTNEDVLANLEGVTIAIKRSLGLADEEPPSP
ncbi:endonuclease domain-containing protein [Bremerella cremea]|uniref:Endonuclease domain-containing protein n=1 Tax=Bremerella cremea TaxID=1031537 RepID=A0A368KVG1_9BACT|nr:endonuclease domain-containing protein [Bremerella cremea]